MGKRPLQFFLDNMVPDSVGKMLIDAGYDVVRLRDCMPTDSKDQIVGIACALSGRVLVTHDKDFRAIAKRLDVSQRRQKKLDQILMRCPEPDSATRLQGALSLIEAEWEIAQDRGVGLWIEITKVAIRTLR